MEMWLSMTKNSKQGGRLDASLHVAARHEHGTWAVECDQRVKFYVCRESQSWNVAWNVLREGKMTKLMHLELLSGCLFFCAFFSSCCSVLFFVKKKAKRLKHQFWPKSVRWGWPKSVSAMQKSAFGRSPGWAGQLRLANWSSVQIRESAAKSCFFANLTFLT